MAEDQTNGESATAGAGAEADAQPQIRIAAQYVKDLSFENPNAPHILTPQEGRPEIQVGVDVQAAALDASNFEVTLRINAEATYGESAAFVGELLYGTVFVLNNIPQESLEPVLLIECPRLMFPFARRILADITRDGGFPPLMLDPIDFVGLYRQNRANQEEPGAAGEAAES
jgi:preprotein translocase subunit SecB